MLTNWEMINEREILSEKEDRLSEKVSSCQWVLRHLRENDQPTAEVEAELSKAQVALDDIKEGLRWWR